MALYHRGYRRDVRSLLVSLLLHVTLVVVFSLLMLSQNGLIQEEIVKVSFLVANPQPPALRRRPPKELAFPQTLAAQSPVPLERQTSRNAISETLRRSQQKLSYDATFERNRTVIDQLPDLTTAAERLRNDDSVELSRAMSSRQLPGRGDGMESFRQRAGGKGAGSLVVPEPTRIANVAIPGDKIGFEEPPPPPDAVTRTPFGDALFRIGEHIADTRTSEMVDVVFVIDTSKSMQDNVGKVTESLYEMTDAFDREALDYRLGVIEFSVRAEGNRILREPLTEDPAILQKQMRRLRVSGDEHALDALVNTLAYLDLRASADKYLILVTDEPASTSWNAPDAYPKLRKQILDECRRRGIAVNVLGHSENYQRNLANLTGGLWQEIPGGQRDGSSSSVLAPSDSVDRLLRDVASRIWHASSRDSQVDVVLMFDYSGSMAPKIAALTSGIAVFQGQLHRYPLDVAYGMIRFAEQPENLGGIRGSLVSQIPIDPDRLQQLLEYPFVGDEHLLDAIQDALPRIQFRPDSTRALVILTDEPSTGSTSLDQALALCQQFGVRVFVIGCLPTDVPLTALQQGDTIRSDEFQVLAPVRTGGFFHPMPGSLSTADATQ